MATDEHRNDSEVSDTNTGVHREEWQDTIDALASQGYSDAAVLATIEYVTTEKSQQDVANAYNVGVTTVQNLQSAVVALGPIDEPTTTPRGRNYTGKTLAELAAEVADALGWESGEEYNRHSDQTFIYVNKPGWRDLHDRLVDDE